MLAECTVPGRQCLAGCLVFPLVGCGTCQPAWRMEPASALHHCCSGIASLSTGTRFQWAAASGWRQSVVNGQCVLSLGACRWAQRRWRAPAYVHCLRINPKKLDQVQPFVSSHVYFWPQRDVTIQPATTSWPVLGRLARNSEPRVGAHDGESQAQIIPFMAWLPPPPGPGRCLWRDGSTAKQVLAREAMLCPD